jgi:PmbA protein
MDDRELAADVLARARRHGADAADTLVARGTDFSVTVRKGQVETLKEAASKALGVRVFVGRRTASAFSSDFTPAALEGMVREAVDMARATGEDAAAGLPDEMVPPEVLELGMYDSSPAALPTAERITRARTAEEAALSVSPEITNSQGASFACGEDEVVLANTLGFLGGYRTSSVSLSVVPVGERNGEMQRDYWYTAGRGLGDLQAPEEVGRIAAQRTLRRLGSRQAATCEVPVVFDPDTADELLGHLFQALSGYAVFRGSTFLREKTGQAIASPLITVVDDGRRPRGLGSRPFDGEGLPTRRNVPVEKGVLRHFLCDSYSARKIGARPTGCARRGVGGGPGVGASNLYLEPGTTPPAQIVGEVEQGLFVTDLIGFGVDLVSGDFSQGAAGHWIENGQLSYPVHEVTIAGNLQRMLLDVDALGDDLVFRGSSASPTLRIKNMTVSGR